MMPLIPDTHIRVSDAETDELLCELPLDPSRKGAECPGRLVPTDVQHPGPIWGTLGPCGRRNTPRYEGADDSPFL